MFSMAIGLATVQFFCTTQILISKLRSGEGMYDNGKRILPVRAGSLGPGADLRMEEEA